MVWFVLRLYDTVQHKYRQQIIAVRTTGQRLINASQISFQFIEKEI
jgi:hypothetical protein